MSPSFCLMRRDALSAALACAQQGGGWQRARAASVAARGLVTNEGQQDFYRAKSLTCRHYCEQVLPESEAHYQAIMSGSDTVLAAAQYI